MSRGGVDDERAAMGGEFDADVQAFVTIGPEVDQDLTPQAVRFNDPPDFERGALVGARH
jgi:hypothetical protein